MVASNEEYPMGSALGVRYRNGESAPAVAERVLGCRNQNPAGAPSRPAAAHHSRTVHAGRNWQTTWTKSFARGCLRSQTGYDPLLFMGKSVDRYALALASSFTASRNFADLAQHNRRRNRFPQLFSHEGY